MVDGPAGGLLVVRVEVRCGVFVVDVPGVLAGAGAGAGLLIEIPLCLCSMIHE